MKAHAHNHQLTKRLIAGCLLALSALPVHPAQAQKRGLSTAAERAQVVARMRHLEENPLAEDGPATREQLREWMIDVPEIRFRMCAELLGHGLPGDYPFAQEINMQVAFSGAVFTMEHPERIRDKSAIDRAGVLGALRVYERLLALRPDARLAFLDDLVARRDRGELHDYVADLAREDWKESYRDQIAMLAGSATALLLGLATAWLFGRRGMAGDRVPGATAAGAHRSSRIVTTCRRIVFVCVA